MIKVHGTTQSRAFRALWMLEELGLEYEHVPVAFGNLGKPEYLAVNPNARVPALEDGRFKLFESMAINLYLAAKYDADGAKGLWPTSLEAQGQTYQWSFWAMQELEGDLLTAMRNRLLLPEADRDADLADAAAERLERPLKVLDAALKGRAHLVTDGFSTADLNTAAVLSWSRGAQIDLAPYPEIARWYGECFGRAARKSASRK